MTDTQAHADTLLIHTPWICGLRGRGNHPWTWLNKYRDTQTQKHTQSRYMVAQIYMCD